MLLRAHVPIWLQTVQTRVLGSATTFMHFRLPVASGRPCFLVARVSPASVLRKRFFVFLPQFLNALFGPATLVVSISAVFDTSAGTNIGSAGP